MLSDVCDRSLVGNSTDGYQSETEFSSFIAILCWVKRVVETILIAKINTKDSYWVNTFLKCKRAVS